MNGAHFLAVVTEAGLVDEGFRALDLRQRNAEPIGIAGCNRARVRKRMAEPFTRAEHRRVVVRPRVGGHAILGEKHQRHLRGLETRPRLREVEAREALTERQEGA